ncbi:MAG: DUF3343 domain-containing protein [Spirochaetes bacterium]|nr:DUF3343 domain-containing protein [Spirochaetota bacterium]
MTVFTFKNTRDVINAEKCLIASGISFTIIPVPRSISSECGMGIESGFESQIENCLSENKISFNKHYDYKK